MAYTDDAVLAKLSALNESHESIATAAQWIMFHRRHADRTVQLWLQRLKDSPSPKRLVLIYLANEVAQQTKARKKEDFLLAFSPIIAEATAAAYKGATSDVQSKLRRVVQVWRERHVFEDPIQNALEARLQDLDNARGTSKASSAFGGGSIFGSSLAPAGSVPAELRDLVKPQQEVSKQVLPVKSSLSTANAEYEKLLNPNDAGGASSLPAPPVYAAKLNGLLKHLASAENAVNESVRARKELVDALLRILETNRSALESELAQQKQLAERRAEVDDKRREVEAEIIRGMGAPPADGSDNHHQTPQDGGGQHSASPEQQEPERPEMEALTPPSGDVEDDLDFYNNDTATPQNDGHHQQQQSSFQSAAPGIEMLSNVASQYQSVPVALNGSHKRRRVDSGDDFPDLGADDEIDADVAEMIRKEGGGM